MVRTESVCASSLGMPTILPQEMNEEQTQIYLLKIQIEELSRRLRTQQYTSQDDRRSPSPEPVYDSNGKRTNTREIRKKHELELRRHEKIVKLLQLNPDYLPPADYRPPNNRLYEKVWIPQDEKREINFVGLLIGPRGNTLKALENETGARIIIRGKGSVKEGKSMKRDGPMPGEHEPLHAFVQSTDPAIIKKAVARIKSILNDAVNSPDANNELRQTQLRELALLNGTLRTGDAFSTRCSNCGSDQHKTFECSEAQNITANIICTSCGSAGHIARDCVTPRDDFRAANNEELDNEYAALLAEIDGTCGKSKEDAAAALATTKPATNTKALPFRLPLQPGHPSLPPLPPSRSFHHQQEQQQASVYLLPPPPPPLSSMPLMSMPPLPSTIQWMPYPMLWTLPPPPPPPPCSEEMDELK